MRSSALAILWFFVASTCLGSSPAAADIVTTRDGARIEGEIVAEDSKTLTLRVGGQALVELPLTEVVKVERKETPRQSLAKRRAGLPEGDAEARFVLASWCREQRLMSEARALLEEVLTLAPEHPGARARLGYLRDGERWVLEADYYRARGFERYKGRWYPAAEVARQRLEVDLKKRIRELFKVFKKGGRASLEAERELLALDGGAVAATLVLPYLEERSSETRRLAARSLGHLAQALAASPLLERALNDRELRVAQDAMRALWTLPSSAAVTSARTRVVQSLYHKSSRLRTRAARMLEVVADRATIPYLIEALYLRRLKVVTEPSESHGVVRAGRSAQGGFGRFNQPASGGLSMQRFRERREIDYVFNPAARRALQALTERDFDYSKDEWFAWWKAEQKARAEPPKPGPQPREPD